MSSTSWTHRFGLSDKEVRDLRNAAGDPLRGALLSGRVNEHEYFEWAMQTHELPRVKSEFFKIPPDPVLYEAIKHEFKWNHSFVPLALWNGVLVIGCLEPPTFHFRISYSARFVLASAQELSDRFDQFEPSKRVVFVPPPPPSRPPPPQSNVVTVATPPPIVVPPPPNVATPQPVVAGPPPVAVAQTPPPVEVEAKSVVVIRPQPEVVEPRKPTLEELLAKPDIDLPSAPDISLDEPDGIVMMPKQASNERMIMPDGISPGTIDVSKDAETLTTHGEAAPEGLSEKTFVTSAKIDFGSLTVSSSNVGRNDPPRLSEGDSETNPRIEAPRMESVPTQTQTQPLASVTAPSIAPFPPTVPRAPTQPADFNTASAAAGSSAVVKNDVKILPFNECNDYDTLAGSALGRVLKTYEVGMILLFQNGQLKPWKWTEMMFSVRGESPDAIDLASASIFRIVFRTCLPYHGYVVASPVNSAFFNAFNRGVLPKHATIMPVLINRKVAGMILGLSGNEIDLRKTLGEMEIVAAEFGSNLDRVKSQQKKAA
ncbi:MAG: hypothetical protein AAB250_09645 [Bdellovibrionota bacterium]